MPDPGISLEEECLREHLESFAFKDGVELAKWGLHENEAVRWPNVVMWVAAAPRGQSPLRYYLFFDLTRYPSEGPTAYLWDPQTRTKLDVTKWPKGTGDVKMVFRIDWNNTIALYCPWDRLAAVGHPEWPTKHPGLLWKPGHTILNYLRPTYELLNSDEYTGS